jgi:hypothetical protein
LALVARLETAITQALELSLRLLAEELAETSSSTVALLFPLLVETVEAVAVVAQDYPTA